MSGLPHEIERKFLLSGRPALPAGSDSVEIEQGWLPGERIRERLRRTRSGAVTTYVRTLKLGKGVQRVEVEEAITPVLFAALWPLTAGCRIRKRRHRVRDGALTWEIDEFLDRELWLAEVELPAADTPAPPPAWLAPSVVREVTDEPAYVNANLARGDVRRGQDR